MKPTSLFVKGLGKNNCIVLGVSNPEATEKLSDWLLFADLSPVVDNNPLFEGHPFRYDFAKIFPGVLLSQIDEVRIFGGIGKPGMDTVGGRKIYDCYWNKEPDLWEWLPNGFEMIATCCRIGSDYQVVRNRFDELRSHK